jgi:hypothetical protein
MSDQAKNRDEEKFEILTNVLDFTPQQVVTGAQIRESHAGVKVEDWEKRGIVRSLEPAAPKKSELSPLAGKTISGESDQSNAQAEHKEAKTPKSSRKKTHK